MLGLTGRRSFVEVERWEKDAGTPGTGEDKIIIKQWKGKQREELYFTLFTTTTIYNDFDALKIHFYIVKSANLMLWSGFVGVLNDTFWWE